MPDAAPAPADARALLTTDPREAVLLLARGARALNLAHFDTVEQEPRFEGARKTHLLSRLEQERLSPDQWGQCAALMRSLSDRPELVEADDWVMITSAFRGGKRGFWRPEVFPALDHLLENHLPRTLLFDWYRAHLCERYQVEDSPAFLSFALEWLEAFNAIKEVTCRRADLLRLVVPPGEASGQWSAALVEALTFLSILEFGYFTRNLDGYHVRQRVDPAFVLTNLFGRSTGVTGLDFLLFGGLWLGRSRAAGGQSVVIRGAPGVGKSTLGLSLAVQTAARGGLALYFRFELGQDAVLGQLANYHRRLLPFFRIESHKGDNLDVPSTRPFTLGADHRGLLVISDAATEPLPEMQRGVVAKVEQKLDFPGPDRLVVLDSVSASRGPQGAGDEWRHFLHETTALLHARGYVVVYLVEADRAGDHAVEEFLADVDIRLQTRGQHDYPYTFRVLEITKSRRQASHRGEHVFSIDTGDGMQVFPSSGAVLSVRRRRESRLRYAETPALIDPGIPDFATFLGSPTRPGPHDGTVSWWMQGSVTALIGPRGTHKSSLAAAFCMTLDRAPGGAASTLSVHFADEFAAGQLKLRREHRRPISVGLRFDVPFRDPGFPDKKRVHNAPPDCTLSYVLFRSGYLAAGHVLQVIRDILSQKRRQGFPVRRAVIADAGNIVPDFPALKADPVFLSALCDLLSSEGITTLLLYSMPEHGAEDFVIDQVRSASENIIQLDPVHHAGRELTSVRVERSANASHSRDVYEIRQDADGPRVLPTFDSVLDVESDRPTSAKVKLLLHAETDLQFHYHDGLRRRYREMGSYQAQVLEHANAFVRHGVSREVMAARRALWVIQVDGYRVPGLVRTAGPGAGLCDLTRLHPRLPSLRAAMVPPLPGESSAADAPGPVYSLPYYLNPSFLVVHRKFHSFLSQSDAGADRRIARGEGDYSWADLLDAARRFKDVAPRRFKDGEVNWDKTLLFDCPLEPGENLLCLFLEILASLADDKAAGINRQDCCHCFGEQSPFGRDRLVMAVRILRDLLQDCYPGHLGHWATLRRSRQDDYHRSGGAEGEKAGTVRPFVGGNAIFWRHWYSTFRQMAWDKSSKDHRVNPNLKLLRLPGGVWTSGDWHLAILEESVAVRAGAAILVEELCSRSAALSRMVEGVGLTPFKAFYTTRDGEMAFPVSEVPADWFAPYVRGENVLDRSSLVHYQEIQPILEGYLGSLVGLEQQEGLDEAIWARFLGLDKIVTDLLGDDAASAAGR
jgi:KaiC/GvpD/RAD55 family RecA-like ATPase